jgi:sporulation protein YlmC with PRC-barrel domain
MMPAQNKAIPACAIAAFMMLPLAAPAVAASPATVQQQAAPAANGSIEVLPAHDLMNRPLRDPQGHDAGRVDGVVINTDDGTVDFVIVASRGNFNLNGNVIAVPWRVFNPQMAGHGPITIKVSAEKLAQAPQLNPNMIGSLEQAQTRGNVNGWWGLGWGWGAPYRLYGGGYGPYAGGRVAPGYGYGPGGPGYGYGPGGPGYAGAPGPAASGPGAGNSARAQPEEQQARPQLTSNGLFVSANGAISALESTATSSANVMRSAPVFASNYASGDRGGAWGGGWGNGGPATIGNIREVMIDPERGDVAFVLIERGGFLGVQPRWYAVPPEALAWAPYQGGYDLTVNENLLNTAPPLESENNKTLNGPVRVPANQLAQLYGHFRLTPYWEQGAAGDAARENTGSSQPSIQR